MDLQVQEADCWCRAACLQEGRARWRECEYRNLKPSSTTISVASTGSAIADGALAH